MSVIFELGPGETFVFDTPGGTTTNHLPEGLKDLEAGIGEGRPIQAIYSLNFGCNGAYILAARNANGAIIRRNNLPPQLESWIIDPVTHTCKRDIATLSVEFGPNNSFYARDKNSYRWHNLPDALEEAIQQRLCPAGWMARPDYVVLGADGAFIYSNDRGGCSHALGNYPKLQEFVLGMQRANIGGLTGFALVQWVSMSIFRPGHFVAVDSTGRHAAELLPDQMHALNSMVGTFPVRSPIPQQPPQFQQRAVSQPIMHQPSPPPMYAASPPPAPAPAPAPMNHAALPVRKPVDSAAAQPRNMQRPQAPHLVSSPTPQTHHPRPAAHPQASAPAVPQVQSPARPVSMQAPPQPGRVNSGNKASMNIKAFGKIASAVKETTNRFSNSQQQHHNNNNNVNSHNNHNTNTNANPTYSNTNANTNTNNSGSTYVVAGDSGSTPSYAPTYIVDVDNSSSTVDNSSVYDTTTTTNNIYDTTTTNVYDDATTTNNTYDTTTTNIYDTTYTDNTTYTTTTDTTSYDPTVISPASISVDSGTYISAADTGASVDDNTTTITETDTTIITDDSGTYDVVDTSAVSITSGDSGIVSSSGGGDSGGFWSNLLS